MCIRDSGVRRRPGKVLFIITNEQIVKSVGDTLPPAGIHQIVRVRRKNFLIHVKSENVT